MAESLHYVTGIPDEIKFVIEEISTKKDVHDIIEQFEHTTSATSSVIDDVESQCEPELELDRSTNLHSIDVTKILTNNSEQSFIEDKYNTNKILELFNEINSTAEDKTEFTKIPLQKIKLNQSKFRCRFCAKSFSIHSYYLGHIKKHRNKTKHSKENIVHTCNTCQKTFKTLFNLTRHERVHTGEKPYACSICDRSFSQPSGLQSHTLSHTGEKPYVCFVCLKGFTHRNYLKNHKCVQIN